MDTFEQTEKLWNAHVKTLEKLSFMSAGTISLSITFLGYILGMGPAARVVLRSSLAFEIQISDLLYLSWIYTAISLFLGLVVRVPAAWHLFNSEVNSSFFKLQQVSDLSSKENIAVVGNITEKDACRYRKISKYVIFFAAIFFILGILSLILFVIIVSNRLMMT